MEITLLLVFLTIQTILLILGLWSRGMLFDLFSGIIGLTCVASLGLSDNTITYVSSGVEVVLNAGAYFILVPGLLCFIAFYHMIQATAR